MALHLVIIFLIDFTIKLKYFFFLIHHFDYLDVEFIEIKHQHMLEDHNFVIILL